MQDTVSRKILLTGVSKGLGRALLQEFVEAGHCVAGCARSSSSIEELRELYPSQNDFQVVDLSSDQDVGRWIESVITNFGLPDLIINNAAIINENAPLWEVPYSDFNRLMSINVNGVFSVIKHVVPHLLKDRSAVIANLSSGWGRSVAADVASYCTSKWAIEGMTLALAEDLPEGIAAIPVNPGVINTEMLQSCFGASADGAQSASDWARRAAPFFLGLSYAQTGQSLSV